MIGDSLGFIVLMESPPSPRPWDGILYRTVEEALTARAHSEDCGYVAWVAHVSEMETSGCPAETRSDW